MDLPTHQKLMDTCGLTSIRRWTPMDLCKKMDIYKLAIAQTIDDDTYGLVSIRIGHNWIVIYCQFALFHTTM